MNPLVTALMAAAGRRGESVVYESALTAGDLKIATKDGEAMFFHDSIDFSAYAGTDAGSTPYRIVLTDSSGNEAVAYGGAVGGGETLGATIVSNGDMETGDPPSGWTANGGATMSRVADERDGGAGTYALNILRGTDNNCYYLNAVLQKSIFRVGGWVKNIDSPDGVRIGSSQFGSTVSSTSWTETSHLRIGTGAINTVFYLRVYTSGNGRFDDLYAKPLTDIPATGLHLMSTKDGTTRNMASEDTGFNPNAVTNIKVYAA